MSKKIYNPPTVSYIGPDVKECLETEAPIAVAVGASVAATIAANVTQRIW